MVTGISFTYVAAAVADCADKGYGAVVGAVKEENVVREEPKKGDVVILFGGRTGRDGIGGATGSSVSHDAKSLTECGSQVQKGNAPTERKNQSGKSV